MRKILFLFFICCFHFPFAQNIQREINDQVWKPFIQTFNEHNTQGFLTLHSKDVVRSPRDSKVVWDWSEYFKNQQIGDNQEKASNFQRQLDLRFIERIASKDQAVEIGIYKTTSTKRNGASRSYYGKFIVVLRKENGVWKILVDTDSSEDFKISEKDFVAALPME